MQSITQSRRASRSVLVGTTAMLAGLAFAGLTGGVANAAAAAAKDSSTVTEVVVTGSRIVRRDFSAPSPIVTVGQQNFEARANVGIETTLNQLPQFTPAGTQFPGDGQPSATNTVGIASINLRGLGTNRTLVLLDGRRPQPANAALVVDLNTIPSAMIDNVEVITGGASAVYGADAIAGVVNFKLKKNYQGAEFDAQYGLTGHGDDREAQVSAVIGGNFADEKGNAMVGMNWSQRSAAYQRDRGFYQHGYGDPNSPGFSTQPFLGYAQYNSLDFNTGWIAGPSQAAVDAIFATKGFAPGTVSSGSVFAVNPDGTLFAPGPQSGIAAPGWTDTANSHYKIVGAGSEKGNLEEVDRNGLASFPLDRYSVFTNAHYDIAEHLTAFIQGMYTKTQIQTDFFNSPAVNFWGITVPRDANHPVPAQLAQLLDSRSGLGVDTNFPNCTHAGAFPIPPAGICLFPINPATEPWALNQDTFAGRRSQIDTSDNFQVLAGLKGDVKGTDWTWEAFGSHGETSQTVDFNSGWVSKQKLQAVINAPNYGQGSTFVSQAGGGQNASIATPGFGGTCTSGLYNTIFSGGAILPSQDCIDLISLRMKSFTDLKQNNVEGDIQGGLINDWAGQIRFSLGADYREEIFEYLPDPNLVKASIVQQPIGLFGTDNSIGKTGAKEGYAELLVPLLRDAPFAKKLELELGGRYSDYNWSGGSDVITGAPSHGGTKAWTYKALGNWTVTDWLTIRGGYQSATRAPNVAELFSGQAQTVVTAPGSGDPCSSTFNQANFGVGKPAKAADAAKWAQAAKLCHYLIDPKDPSYDPNTYVGLFGGNFPIDIAIEHGNANLSSEVATTETLGFILNSPSKEPLLRRFRMSADYYTVAIKGGIAVILPQLAYQQCFNAGGNSNLAFANASATGADLAAGNAYCSLLHREAGTGYNRNADSPYFNLGHVKTAGVDIQLDWSADLKEVGTGLPGNLSLNFVMNWLQKYQVQGSPTGGYSDYVGTTGSIATTGGAQFRYKTFTTITYADGPGMIGLRWQHLPGLKSSSSVGEGTTIATPLVGAPSYDMFDLFAGWKINSTYALRFGVDNLFDKDPPIIENDPTLSASQHNGSNSLSTIPGLYDVLGRRFYVGLKARF